MYNNVFNPNNTLRSFLSSASRRYATAQKHAPSKPIPRASPLKATSRVAIPKRIPTSGDLESARKLKSIEVAETLFSVGERSLYRAPKRLTIFRGQNWALMGGCLAFVGWYASNRTWDAEEWKKKGITYPRFISSTYTAIGAFVAAIAGLCAYRAGRHIHTINLVKQLDHVFLQVSVRSYLPFYKQRYILEPYNLCIDSRLVAMKRIPEWMLARNLDESSPSAVTASVISNTFRAFSRMFFWFFSAARQFISQEGILAVDLVTNEAGQQKTLKGFSLDMAGTYLLEGDAEVIFKMATIYDPLTSKR